MKLGISTYCMVNELRDGRMNVLDVLQWAKENECEHVELVPYGYSLVDDPALADQVRDKTTELGLVLSNYSLPANFYQPGLSEFKAEVERLKTHVDLLQRLGIQSMRHDVVAFTVPHEETGAGGHPRKIRPRHLRGMSGRS
ncbi:sugar phosphate isomerase/epimerase family protein [Paenibacillus puldeungensis]|uniref:Sugar phosphate isomerase/epimerase family protein n=2 Tax=Paenibacillus puldeungensis TaxID=696536 RepID=A0ABW3RWU1_9BACL